MKKKTSKDKLADCLASKNPHEIGPEAIIGIMTIEMEALVEQLKKAKLINHDEFKKTVIERVKKFIQTGVLAHGAGGTHVDPEILPDLEQVKADTRYIG